MDVPMAASGTGIVEILLYGGGIILLILVSYAAMLWLRRRVRSIGDGRISRQEFAKLRQGVLDIGA